MGGRYEIELEAEVQEWLDSLPATDYLRVMKLADFLADHAETLGDPKPVTWAEACANCGYRSIAASSASRTGLHPSDES